MNYKNYMHTSLTLKKLRFHIAILARFLIFLASLSSHTFVFASSGLCVQIFNNSSKTNSFEFPLGYKLTEEQITTIYKRNSLRPLLNGQKNVIDLIENMSNEHWLNLSEHLESSHLWESVKSESDLQILSKESKYKEFPYDFWKQYLSKKDPKMESVFNKFFQLKNHFLNDLPAETLVLLAYHLRGVKPPVVFKSRTLTEELDFTDINHLGRRINDFINEYNRRHWSPPPLIELLQANKYIFNLFFDILSVKYMDKEQKKIFLARKNYSLSEYNENLKQSEFEHKLSPTSSMKEVESYCMNRFGNNGIEAFHIYKLIRKNSNASKKVGADLIPEVLSKYLFKHLEELMIVRNSNHPHTNLDNYLKENFQGSNEDVFLVFHQFFSYIALDVPVQRKLTTHKPEVLVSINKINVDLRANLKAAPSINDTQSNISNVKFIYRNSIVSKPPPKNPLKRKHNKQNSTKKIASDLNELSEGEIKVKDNAMDLESFSENSYSPNNLYYVHDFMIKSEGLKDIQYIKISPQVLKDLSKKQMNIDSWISAFKHGKVSYKSKNGIKQLMYIVKDKSCWEIKVMDVNYRIIMRRDKGSNTWHWLALVKHDQVSAFLRVQNSRIN